MDWVKVGALWGLLGVALGAFGAHGLEGRVTAEELAWWETAALYHLLHAPAIVVAGLARAERPRAALAGALFLAGSLLFSGTLYGMALGGPRWLGAVTPLGGLALMGGWLALALAGRRVSTI